MYFIINMDNVIILISKNTEPLYAEWSQFKFVLYYNSVKDKTIAMIFTFNNNHRFIKEYSGNLYHSVFNQIKNVLDLPFDPRTKTYYGDELYIFYTIPNQKGYKKWKNVNPNSCSCMKTFDCHCARDRFVQADGGFLGPACGCNNDKICDNPHADFLDRISLDMRNEQNEYYQPTQDQQALYDYVTYLLFYVMRILFKNEMVMKFSIGI